MYYCGGQKAHSSAFLVSDILCPPGVAGQEIDCEGNGLFRCSKDGMITSLTGYGYQYSSPGSSAPASVDQLQPGSMSQTTLASTSPTGHFTSGYVGGGSQYHPTPAATIHPATPYCGTGSDISHHYALCAAAAAASDPMLMPGRADFRLGTVHKETIKESTVSRSIQNFSK